MSTNYFINCNSKRARCWYEFKLRTVFLSNLAQILTSCSKMNVKSTIVHSIFQCTEAYFILPTDKKRSHLISRQNDNKSGFHKWLPAPPHITSSTPGRFNRTLSFWVSSSVQVTEGVTYDVWFNVTDRYFRFINTKPHSRSILPTFQAPRNIYDHYGVRMKTYFNVSINIWRTVFSKQMGLVRM